MVNMHNNRDLDKLNITQRKIIMDHLRIHLYQDHRKIIMDHLRIIMDHRKIIMDHKGIY